MIDYWIHIACTPQSFTYGMHKTPDTYSISQIPLATFCIYRQAIVDSSLLITWFNRDIASRFREGTIDEARDELDNTSFRNQDTRCSPNVQGWSEVATNSREEELAHPAEVFVGVTDEDEDDDTTIPPAELEAYRRLITGSDSYDWLISKLRCDLSSCVPGETDVRMQISRLIYSHPALRHLSRKGPQPVFQAVFTIEWDPRDFLHGQDYKKHPTEALWDALTLTGRANEAEGLACGDYICRTWPHSGPRFLELLECVLQPGLNPVHEGELQL